MILTETELTATEIAEREKLNKLHQNTSSFYLRLQLRLMHPSIIIFYFVSL